MEDTLILETGLHAPFSVGTELKPEQELALTLLLSMVVLTVLGRLLKLDLVEIEIVQVCSYYLNFIHDSRRDNYYYISTLLHYILYILYVIYWIISKYFSEFRLVDQDGNKVGARVEGLLLSNGGTVCDDSFSDNSADAICREMGFPRGYSWRNSNQWILFQVTFDISLDDVWCRNGEFTSCTYNLEHNCGHSEDVFLACDTDETGECPQSTHNHDCIARSLS